MTYYTIRMYTGDCSIVLSEILYLQYNHYLKKICMVWRSVVTKKEICTNRLLETNVAHSLS